MEWSRNYSAKGVIIGAGRLIGAGRVVTKGVPPYDAVAETLQKMLNLEENTVGKER